MRTHRSINPMKSDSELIHGSMKFTGKDRQQFVMIEPTETREFCKRLIRSNFDPDNDKLDALLWVKNKAMSLHQTSHMGMVGLLMYAEKVGHCYDPDDGKLPEVMDKHKVLDDLKGLITETRSEDDEYFEKLQKAFESGEMDEKVEAAIVKDGLAFGSIAFLDDTSRFEVITPCVPIDLVQKIVFRVGSLSNLEENVAVLISVDGHIMHHDVTPAGSVMLDLLFFDTYKRPPKIEELRDGNVSKSLIEKYSTELAVMEMEAKGEVPPDSISGVMH